MTLFTDIAYHNVGARENGKLVIHPFNWQKSIDKGVEGTFIKAAEGMTMDPAFDLSMSTCPLPYRGVYGYVKYTQTAYPIGGEIAWGKKTAQLLLDLSDKHNCNTRVMIDAEQNAYWEKLQNTLEDRALDRFLKITAAQVYEIWRLTGYFPVMYTNPWLTRFMDSDFGDCPLLIAAGTKVMPKISNWEAAAGIQFDWVADGQAYGNYYGNPAIDLDEIFDVNEILIPGRTAFGTTTVQAEDGVESPEARKTRLAELTLKLKAMARRKAKRANEFYL